MVRPSCPLTFRETEILSAMADGLGCRQIARTLSISEHTVRKHRSNMLAKLELHNAPQLIAHAREQGWLTSRSVQPSTATIGRERDVMALVVEGHTSKQIARVLCVSYLTVRKHRENALRKLGLKNTAQWMAVVSKQIGRS